MMSETPLLVQKCIRHFHMSRRVMRHFQDYRALSRMLRMFCEVFRHGRWREGWHGFQDADNSGALRDCASAWAQQESLSATFASPRGDPESGGLGFGGPGLCMASGSHAIWSSGIAWHRCWQVQGPLQMHAMDTRRESHRLPLHALSRASRARAVLRSGLFGHLEKSAVSE